MHRFDTDQRDGFGLLSERTICSAAEKSEFAYLEAKGKTGYFVFPARKSTKNYTEVAVEFVAAGPVFWDRAAVGLVFPARKSRKNYTEVAVEFVAAGPVFWDRAAVGLVFLTFVPSDAIASPPPADRGSLKCSLGARSNYGCAGAWSFL